jgi:hypothetical protein
MHGGQIAVLARDVEIVPYGDTMGEGELRTLAEAEGAPAWEDALAGAPESEPPHFPRPRPRPRPREEPEGGDE